MEYIERQQENNYNRKRPKAGLVLGIISCVLSAAMWILINTMRWLFDYINTADWNMVTLFFEAPSWLVFALFLGYVGSGCFLFSLIVGVIGIVFSLRHKTRNSKGAVLSIIGSIASIVALIVFGVL